MAELGNVSSALSRLQHVNELLTVQRENLAAAYSRITDIDLASEVAKFLRTQIITQAASAMLAQANQEAKIVAKLLEMS
ncbi:MAG: hypothetical protein GYA55_08095 [SAR324 cluster bacterium]|uniref:Flagellin C-terminal domain-containing protein n=1 Tax=SAR324 cluster bacterium TaxID=2024889 RepID=A0A7X9IJX9_9DELT|nr:hypothetical protein [SAR324 cluster bacterium]